MHRPRAVRVKNVTERMQKEGVVKEREEKEHEIKLGKNRNFST